MTKYNLSRKYMLLFVMTTYTINILKKLCCHHDENTLSSIMTTYIKDKKYILSSSKTIIKITNMNIF